MQLKIYNVKAAEVGSMELNDSVFGVEYNEALIHQVVVAQRANSRQGTKSTLTRAEVRGGGIKPWRQKGTGRARQGSIRSPQWIKGGVAFAPKPRDFSKKVNRSAKFGAFLSALSYKAANSEITLLDNLTLEQAKTKLIADVLKNFKLGGKTLVVVAEHDATLLRAARNIKNLTIATSDLVSVYEIVANKHVLATVDAIKSLEEACANESI